MNTQKSRPKTLQAFASELNEQHHRGASALPTILGSRAKARKALPTTAPPADDHIPFRWREAELLPMKVASAVSGVSVASLYRLADAGKLKLRTLAGRTLVVAPSLIALIDNAPDWTPTNRGAEARARRREITRESHVD